LPDRARAADSAIRPRPTLVGRARSLRQPFSHRHRRRRRPHRFSDRFVHAIGSVVVIARFPVLRARGASLREGNARHVSRARSRSCQTRKIWRVRQWELIHGRKERQANAAVSARRPTGRRAADSTKEERHASWRVRGQGLRKVCSAKPARHPRGGRAQGTWGLPVGRTTSSVPRWTSPRAVNPLRRLHPESWLVGGVTDFCGAHKKPSPWLTGHDMGPAA